MNESTKISSRKSTYPTESGRSFCMFVSYGEALISGFHSNDVINFIGNKNVRKPILKKTCLMKSSDFF